MPREVRIYGYAEAWYPGIVYDEPNDRFVWHHLIFNRNHSEQTFRRGMIFSYDDDFCRSVDAVAGLAGSHVLDRPYYTTNQSLSRLSHMVGYTNPNHSKQPKIDRKRLRR